MKMPDFLIIGAAKSGTISLYHYLSEHPQVFMCPVNETNFFALEKADFSRSYQGPIDRQVLDRHCIKDLDAYSALFAGAEGNQQLGECSPLYLYDRLAAERIRHHIPAVKLIAILRRPESRAFSNYRHFRRAGIEPLETFQEALKAESSRIADGWGPWPFWHYRQMGYYSEQLERYFSLFDPNQVFVGLFEDLVQNPRGLMQDIFQFLEVDADFLPDVSTRYNLGGTPRSDRVHKILTDPSRWKQVGKRLVPLEVRRRTRLTLLRWNTSEIPVDRTLQVQLNRGYQQDILQLQQLLRRDLSGWKLG